MKIALCLSGGGFRAMLFHLGVIRRLAEAKLLANITRVDSVSGGSILAAHLALNWDAYREGATRASEELVALAKRDVRGRIVRRRLLSLLCGIPLLRRLLALILPSVALRLRLRVTDLLEREYSRLFRGKRLQALCTGKDGGLPEVYLHATSLAAGRPCAFAIRRSHTGTRSASFLIRQSHRPDEAYSAESVRIALAVAASSAFPPMFQPIEVSGEIIGDEHLEITHPLTDGGVFDNLAVHWQCAELPQVDVTLISDASGGLVPDYKSKFRSLLTRNIRSSDIMMSRNAGLSRKDAGLDLVGHERSSHEFGENAHRIPIDPGFSLKHDLFGGPQKQKALRNVRTDLDAFSDVEIGHLLAHGWATADAVLRDARIIPEDATVPPPSMPPETDFDVLRRSSRRRLRLWAPADLFGMLYVPVLLAWMVVGLWIAERASNRPTIRLDDQQWADVSKIWFNEPSGLAATGLTRQGAPVLLGVDDEESALFILQHIPDRHPGIINVGRLTVGGKDLKDLEGVAFDPCTENGKGVVVTSHRRSENDGVHRMIFFTLANGWEGGSESPIIIQGNGVDLGPHLHKVLKDVGVPIDKNTWSAKLDGDHPYALEIEGIAYAQGTVTLGMRWPLVGGKAIIWTYANGTAKTSELVDLGGFGISAMTWVGDELYIAANPPEKEPSDPPAASARPEEEGITDEGPYGPYGQSRVFRRTRDGRIYEVEGLDAVKRGAKLEGLAVVDGKLMGAFDGDTHDIRQLEPKIAPVWWQSLWKQLRGRTPSTCP